MAGKKGDYEVGYGKPPRNRQFKKGQSGNAAGKRPGTRGIRAALLRELNAFVEVPHNGGTRKVRVKQIMMKSLAHKAAKAEMRVTNFVYRELREIEEESLARERKQLSAADQLILGRLLGAIEESPPNDGADADEPSGADGSSDAK